MAPHPSSPELVAPANGSADPELLSLPRPPRLQRTISLVLMTVTAFLALVMTVALAGDVHFAFASAVPDDVGDMMHFVPDASMKNRFVRGTGMLSSASAIRYERPMERDSFRLAPLAGNDNIWVEMRVPEGVEGGQFVPPATFVGRLLPMHSAAFRYRGLGRSIHEVTGAGVPENAWVLVDGATPASSRWTVALAALFAIFAAYNLVTIARIVRPVRK
jgi:hypothetical protein